MKINLDKIFLAIYFILFAILIIYFVTPNPDFYSFYYISGRILENLSILWSEIPQSEYMTVVPAYSEYLGYPPLMFLIYMLFIAVRIPYQLFFIFSAFGVGYLLYKIKAEAIPFLFLSFMFIRTTTFGHTDTFLVFLTLITVYFYDKNPIISGIASGLSPLVKGTGFFVLGSYGISIIYNKREQIFNNFKNFIKSVEFKSLLIAILILSPWYLRNFVIYEGDIVSMFAGQSKEILAKSEQILESGIQSNQPERYWWDSTGFYPLPIDLLVWIGTIFTLYNLIKKKKIKTEHIFIFVFLIFYIIGQVIQFNFIMSLRYLLPILPLLAIQITETLGEKKLKIMYVLSLLVLIFFVLSLQKYSFNDLDSQMTPLCEQIKPQLGSKPVFIKAFHNWYTIYKCDLNATSEIESTWTLDLNKGDLYLTNKTNISS